MIPSALSWLLLSMATLFTGVLLCRCASLSRARQTAVTVCATAREGEARVTRCLQLFSQDLQALALTLRGHADQLCAEQHEHAPAVAVVVAQLGGLADELGHHLIPSGGPRVLDCEAISLAGMAGEAVEAIAAAISPGHRNWRISAGTHPGLMIWADRRALRLVFVRVLGEAVRSSGHNDFIDIGWSIDPTGLAVCIEDEGTGTSLAGAAGTALDSRGISLRLSLARALTLAHGGTLEVEAMARIGTRVTIRLPEERLRLGEVLLPTG